MQHPMTAAAMLRSVSCRYAELQRQGIVSWSPKPWCNVKTIFSPLKKTKEAVKVNKIQENNGKQVRQWF